MGYMDCHRPENQTVERAHAEASGAIRAMVEAARASKEFGTREQAAVLLLDEGTRPAREASPSREVCRELLDAIGQAHRRLGAPGDFGYDTDEGRAMQWLYASTGLLAAVVPPKGAASC